VVKLVGGKALDGLGGVKLTEPNQTGNAYKEYTAVGRWVMRFIVERERTQTYS
jgi:hypothetical protein